jgi:two-component SAPR family response regulator
MTDRSTDLRDLGVFVVEDEALVALNLEDMLADLGCRVIGPAMRLSRAAELLASAPRPDLAILDVNVGGQPVFDLASEVERLGIPIIFATGYGRSGLPEAWHSWPILQKPYTLAEVASGIQDAMRRATSVGHAQPD